MFETVKITDKERGILLPNDICDNNFGLEMLQSTTITHGDFNFIRGLIPATPMSNNFDCNGAFSPNLTECKYEIENDIAALPILPIIVLIVCLDTSSTNAGANIVIQNMEIYAHVYTLYSYQLSDYGINSDVYYVRYNKLWSNRWYSIGTPDAVCDSRIK